MSEINSTNSTALTFADIKELFRQTAEQMKQTAEQFTRTEELFKQTAEQTKRTDEQIKQTDEQIKQTAEQFTRTEELFKQTAEQIKQTDEQIKQTAEQMKQTDERMKRTDEQLGKLGNRFGEVTEHLIAAGVADRFNEIGYNFPPGERNFKVTDNKDQTIAEIDVLLENEDYFIVVEAKLKPRMDDIIYHVEKMEKFKQYFMKNQEKQKKVFGALAGVVFDDNIKTAAIKNGLYTIVQSGNAIKIDVPKGFQPKLF
jgi:DNA repair exonuclease SbcCD ATPase subunit